MTACVGGADFESVLIALREFRGSSESEKENGPEGMEKAKGQMFNVADIAICVGVGLFLLSSLLRKPARTGEGASSSPSGQEE